MYFSTNYKIFEMRHLLFLTFAISSIAFFGCGEDEAKKAARDKMDATTPATTQAPNTSGAAGSVEHYICPNGHIGSGAAAEGNCSECGAALVHNQAFHANDPNNAASQNIQTTTPTPTTPEPAQNSAGVWHYTCANGCEGGAGAQGACPKCGGQMAHNAAYHNQ